MKNLTREQDQTRLKLCQKLYEVGEDIQDAIKRHNQLLENAREEIESLVGHHNELVQEAQGFVGGVHDEQEAYSSDRSERWHESDAGQAYEEWKDAWDVALEELEIAFPDEIEDAPLDALETLRNMPEQP